MKKRNALIKFLAQHWLDAVSLRDLEIFFYDAQIDYLESYSDEELISEVEDVMSEEDFNLFIAEVEDEA
jgi:hypothetical protein